MSHTTNTKDPAGKLVSRAVAVTVICGALAVGTGGAAFASTTTTTTTARCARAPKVVNRLSKIESAATGRISKLDSAESRLTAAGRSRLAARVERRIERLRRIEARATARATRIESRCPSGTSGSSAS